MNDQESIYHMITAICCSIELDNNKGHDESFENKYILIDGNQVDKKDAFSKPEFLQAPLILVAEIILNDTLGSPAWNINFVKDPSTLAGFTMVGRPTKELWGPKALAIRGALQEMSELSPDGVLDLTYGLKKIAYAVSKLGKNTFDHKDVAGIYAANPESFGVNLRALEEDSTQEMGPKNHA